MRNCININHENYTYTEEKLLNSKLTQVGTVINLGAFTPKNVSEADDIDGAFQI
ncbi:MAG: hypothetical protein RR891_09010 [Clostridium sp.]